MSKRVLTMGVAFCAAFATVAGPVSAASPPHATGGVTVMNADGVSESKISFNGHGSPTHAKGMINFRNLKTGVDYKVAVNCYFQNGANARLTGTITKGDFAGQFVTLTVQDNGEGPGTPDTVAINRRTINPYQCTVPRVPRREVIAGNLQTHGAGNTAMLMIASTGGYLDEDPLDPDITD